MTDDTSQAASEEESSQRREHSQLDKLDGAELPIDVDDPTFEAPWQARAFAIAVVLSNHREGIYSWKDFQETLVDEIQSTSDIEQYRGSDGKSDSGINGSESEYYERWLRALERIAFNEELIDVDEVRRRAQEFAEGDRDASEFIEGEHNHTHSHSDSHAHPHDHNRSEDRTNG